MDIREQRDAVTVAGDRREEVADRLLEGSARRSYNSLVDVDWDAPQDPNLDRETATKPTLTRPVRVSDLQYLAHSDRT